VADTLGCDTEHGREGSLRIAILGTRGIPGNYGGFETFAEEFSARLVERGHDATVYCRTGNASIEPASHRGVRLVHLPAIRHKYAETISHTLLSAIHALFGRYDVVYVCNSANAPICWIPWLRRQRVVLNVDGLEWRRAKWGRIARRYYRWAAKLAAHMPIEVVTDAVVIQEYYLRTWKRATRCFAYGTTLYERGHGADRVRALGLEPDGYLLYVSRLEPENNALLVVQAYAQLATDIPLVIVGDAPYAQPYISAVKAAADERVRFLGYQFGEDYHALQANALIYVQATEVGGTHPALVEALGHRNAVVAHDVPEHREVVGSAGRYFARRDAADLAAQLRALLDDRDAIEDLRARAERRVKEHYSWDAVTAQYEAYFTGLASGG
jgi:glycosyltransferase involved in cell wall biosynthesis